MFIFLYDMQGMTMLSQPQVSCVINISWNSINDICTDIINVSVLIYINAFVLANMRRGRERVIIIGWVEVGREVG